MLEKIFHLKENHTDVKTELMAGVTTFMTMAYILAVNPSILSASGMDANAVLIATSLASFIGTALMALLANYPFALAPGMGLNAYFSYTVVLTMGYSWQLALMAVFVEGIIFIVLSLTNVREAIFNAIPMTLKSAVSVGIGLFVAFVGLQNAKLIVNSDSTLVTYQHFKGETFHSIGVGAILTLVGVLITAILLVKKVKGGILYGILITWVLGILCELTGIYIPNPDAGMYSVIPTSFISFDFSALGKTFGQVFKTDFSGVGILNFFAVMFSFLFVDLFDTLGTLIGVASKADMLDEEGKLPRIKGALMADSIATCAGAVLGTSTTTTFVESASGVTEGGRTGLTSMTTGILFLLAVVFSPLFLTIPSFATAPALIIVGYTILGGFRAVTTTDLIQSIVMSMALVAVLVYGISVAGGWGAVVENAQGISGYLTMMASHDAATGGSTSYSLLDIVSTMAWGLGYFGMPHILLRFMAIEDEKKLVLSRRIATVWVVIAMAASIVIGMVGLGMTRVGALEFLSGSSSETLIVRIASLISQHGVLAAVLAGLILAGILAATMSTADSQMLAAASSVSQNILQEFGHLKLSEKQSLFAARLTIICVSVVGVVLARDPDSSVFGIVSFAWAGFGGSFGAVVLCALFWKRCNWQGALAGMLCGGLMVFVWKYIVSPLGGVFGIYELLPAFLVSLAVCVVVSLVTPAPTEDILAEFDAAK